MGVEPLGLALWFLPMGVGGACLVVMEGYVLHLIGGTVILGISGLAIISASLLLAMAPQNAGYWQWVFPSMICQTLSIEFVFNMTSVFLSTSLPTDRQGLAGSLGEGFLQLSVSTFLGLAGIVTQHNGSGKAKEIYQRAFWFEMACGACALVVALAFVRIGKANNDFTTAEKQAFRGSSGGTDSDNSPGVIPIRMASDPYPTQQAV